MATAGNNENINVYKYFFDLEPEIREIESQLRVMENDIKGYKNDCRNTLKLVLSSLRKANSVTRNDSFTADDERIEAELNEESEDQQNQSQQQTPTSQQPQPEPQPERPASFKERFRAEHRGGKVNPFIKAEYDNKVVRMQRALRKGDYLGLLLDPDVLPWTPQRRANKKIMDESWRVVRQIPKEAAKSAGAFVLKAAISGGSYIGGKGKSGVQKAAGFVYRNSSFVQEKTEWLKKQSKSAKRTLRKNTKVRLAATRRAAERKRKKDKHALQKFLLEGTLRFAKDFVLDKINQLSEAGQKLYRGVRQVTHNRFVNSQVGKSIINSNTAKNIKVGLETFKNTDTYRSIASRTSAVINNTPEALRATGRNIVRVGDSVRNSRAVRWSQAGISTGAKAVVKPVELVIKNRSAIWNGARATARGVVSVGKAAPRGAMSGLAMSLVTQNIAAGVAFGLAATAVGSVAAYSTSNATRGLKNAMGDWDNSAFGKNRISPEAQQRIINRGNVYSNATRAFRALDAGTTVASLGAIAATVLGGNPLLAAGFGFAAGAGGRFLIDRFVGNRVAQYMQGNTSGLLNKIAHLPSGALLNQAVSSQWLGEQIRLLRSDYDNDLGRYLQDNFTLTGGGGMQTFTVITNYIGAASYISGIHAGTNALLSRYGSSVAMEFANRGIEGSLERIGLGLSKGVSSTGFTWRGALGSVANIIKQPFRFIASGPLSLTNPITLGATVGGVVGTVLATALGFGGPAALAAGGIGGIAGAVAGASAAGALIGAATLGTVTAGIGIGIGAAVGSFIGTLFGSYIGSLADRTVNSVLEGFTNRVIGLFNGVMALFNLMKMLRNGINPEDALGFLMAFGMLFTIISRNWEQGGEAVFIEQENIKQGYESIEEPRQAYKLDHYNISLINTNEQWTPERIRILMDSLAQTQSDDFENGDRNILLAIGREESVEVDGNLLIYIDPNTFTGNYRNEPILSFNNL